MPSIKYLMLRSARRARLEARITPVQPMRRSFLDSFTTSEEVAPSRRRMRRLLGAGDRLEGCTWLVPIEAIEACYE